jgi:hypothetical protein
MTEPRIARIRTSDRSTFKRCRRKWKWSNSLGDNLQEDQARGPLWGGTGFHYALEDYHGHNKHGHPSEAFRAFVKATRTASGQGVPADYEELTTLFTGMLDYYVEWLKNRETFKTLWIDGVPQVEVRFEIPLPISQDVLDKAGFDEVRYQGTIDRMVIDNQERIWILDHKTAQAFATMHFETDPQVSSYCWASSVLFDRPVAGFIYQQYRKKIAEQPEVLKSGKISTAKTLNTTHALYRKALLNLYGDIMRAPPANIEYLNGLAAAEGPEEDSMIRRDYIFRSPEQWESEGARILQEVTEMLNPDLSIYTNPTRDCSWDCPFMNPCVLMDCGDDWQEELSLSTMKRDNAEGWRKHV